MSFIIMEKLGKTLLSYMQESESPFSLKTICHLGIELLEALERMHLIGCIHNDLKLDNVLIGDHCSSKHTLGDI